MGRVVAGEEDEESSDDGTDMPPITLLTQRVGKVPPAGTRSTATNESSSGESSSLEVKEGSSVSMLAEFAPQLQVGPDCPVIQCCSQIGVAIDAGGEKSACNVGFKAAGPQSFSKKEKKKDEGLNKQRWLQPSNTSGFIDDDC